MEKFTLEVTSKHISKGVRKDATSCPIALAARSLKLREVVVGQDSLDFNKGRKKYHAYLPKLAQKFITKFDDNSAVKPFSFVVRPIEVDGFGVPVKSAKPKKSSSSV